MLEVLPPAAPTTTFLLHADPSMPSNVTIPWLPLLPGWAILLTAAVFLALLLHGSFLLRRKQVPVSRVLSLAGLRLLIGAVLLLLLLRPVVSFSRTEEQLPELAVLVDTSQSMERPGGKTGQSRLDDVRAALDGPLGSALHGRYRLHYFAIDRTASPLPDGRLADLQPTGSQTLYADSLAAAVELLRAEGITPERVLLAGVRATVTLPGDRRVPLVFAADATDPGLWRTEFAPAQSGAYRVRAHLTAGGQPLADAEAIFDVPATAGEQSDAGVDRAALERLATRPVARSSTRSGRKPGRNRNPGCGLSSRGRGRSICGRTGRWYSCSWRCWGWLVRLRRGFV
jgi:hypothetical protein